jgi:hypothetical protein
MGKTTMKQNVNIGNLGRTTFNALKRAELLGKDKRFQAAVDNAAVNEEARKEALNNARQYLENQGVVIPKNVSIKFIIQPSKPIPPPDQPFFVLRLFNCQSYWVRKKNEPVYERVEVCFGYELTPSIVTGGPVQ